MKKTESKQEHPQTLKRKLMSALAMLLISTILMTTTSYAWFVLSTAPEVTGIETQVGANGSLEIALLNTQTRTDMSLIRSGLGDSIAAGNLAANNAWGNLIDLGFVDYGLGQILLLPARLNAVGNPVDGYTVDPGMLAIPTYGYDGRVIDTTDNTVSAIYQNNEFSFVNGVQDYGVRAIGASDALTAQESALANAKGNIPTYTKSARSNAQAVLSGNGDTVFNIMLNHMSDEGYVYSDTDRDALKAMLEALKKSLDDIDAAMRQGLVGYAASELDGEDEFNQAKDMILSESWDDILTNLNNVGSIPAEFSAWADDLADMQNDLNAAKNACDALTGGSYTWLDIRGILNYVMNVDYVYIEDSLFANVDQNAIMDKALAGEEITMTLAPGSGIFAGLADFAGNYSSSMSVMGIVDILITTASAVEPVYLNELAAAVNGLKAAGGTQAVALPLSVTYGYALDLAFRCNAEDPDLVLQTTPEQRVYNDSESGSTQGGGSYMEFATDDTALTMEQRLKLMDAIRVGFLDDQGKLLGIAKLNVSNYAVEGGMVNAPLYLYEYELTDDGHGLLLTMGERKLTDNLITDEMQQSVAKALTVIVWLDGDIVDNSMVSATEAASLSGVLNLQFATSAELIPASDASLLGYTPDRTGLEAVIEAYAATFEAGQGIYTNVSWNAFEAAYNRAVTVSDNDNAGAVEVANAVTKLSAAGVRLTEVSKDAVNNKITELRQMMGTVSGETGSLVIKNADGTYSAVGSDEHTQEVHDSWDIVSEIERVDYNKNLNDEGNEIYTPIYSEESWNALANALYQAEAAVQSNKATDEQLNAVLTAMENAQKALTRQVFFTPYEYRGSIYYEAICDAANADTYGKWYDSSFKRVISDLTILNLDAYAEKTIIVELGQNAYVSSDAEYITPDIGFLEEVFPELRDVEVMGVHWNEIDSRLFTEMMNQVHYNKLAELVNMVDTDPVLQHELSDGCVAARDAAYELITKWTNKEVTNEEVTAAEAEAAISDLNDQIIDLYDQNLAKMEEASTVMTENQRILLTAAVNAAKAIDGFENPSGVEDAEEKAKLETLVAKTTAAETLLQNSGTKDEANTALTELNAALKDAGGEEVTEHNTLTHKLPEGFGEDDIVYSVDYPGINLKLTGKSGTTTIGAQVLTKDGVVIRVSKDITVYDMADGVKITQAGSDIASLSLAADGAADITAQLFWEAGGINTGDKPLAEVVQEEVRNYTWASTDTNVVTVAPQEAGTCTVTAVGGGSAQVTLSIETKAGNFYTIEITVTVSE